MNYIEVYWVYAQRIQGYQEETHMLKVAQEDRSSKGRGRCVFRGGCGRGRGRQPLNKAIIECFKCHKLGHFQYECPDWENNANYVGEEEELLLMSYEVPHHTKKEHMIPRLGLQQSYDGKQKLVLRSGRRIQSNSEAWE